MKKTILRNDDDLLKFIRDTFIGFPPVDMNEALFWLKANECERPKKYPCHVEFTSRRVEFDDVGFGSYRVCKINYTYREDYEKELDLAMKNLKELRS